MSKLREAQEKKKRFLEKAAGRGLGNLVWIPSFAAYLFVNKTGISQNQSLPISWDRFSEVSCTEWSEKLEPPRAKLLWMSPDFSQPTQWAWGQTRSLLQETLKICPLLLFTSISHLLPCASVVNLQRAALNRLLNISVDICLIVSAARWPYTIITDKSNTLYRLLLSRQWIWSSGSLLLHCCRHQLSLRKDREVWCFHSYKCICLLLLKPPLLLSRLLHQEDET